MLTLKKVKEMVKAPVHTKRVPSPKVLLEDGRILLRKEFEHDSFSICFVTVQTINAEVS